MPPKSLTNKNPRTVEAVNLINDQTPNINNDTSAERQQLKIDKRSYPSPTTPTNSSGKNKNLFLTKLFLSII